MFLLVYILFNIYFQPLDISIYFPGAVTVAGMQVVSDHPQMVGAVELLVDEGYGSTTSIDKSDERPSRTALESPCIAVTIASMQVS